MRTHDLPFDAVIPVTNAKGAEPVIYASAAQLHVYGESRAYSLAAQRLDDWMRKVAHSISRDDPAFAEDLVAEARVKLWNVDPSRLTTQDEPWLKRTLRLAMRSAARIERKQSGGRRAVQAHLRTW